MLMTENTIQYACLYRMLFLEKYSVLKNFWLLDGKSLVIIPVIIAIPVNFTGHTCYRSEAQCT